MALAAESVITTLAVYHQISPPTINIFEQDPECDRRPTPMVLAVPTVRWCFAASDLTGGGNGKPSCIMTVIETASRLLVILAHGMHAASRRLFSFGPGVPDGG